LGEIRPYTEEELKDVRVSNPMETEKKRQVLFAHTLLHMSLRVENDRRPLKSWPFLAVVKEHVRIVKHLLNLGYAHRMKDDLDKTLPIELQRNFPRQASKRRYNVE
jgi:hypothetical protein